LDEALRHAALFHRIDLQVDWIDSEELTDAATTHQRLAPYAGILVPGGYGERGVEGKIQAITWARTHQIPFLGICLGLQLTMVEGARNLLNLPHAHSTEFQATRDPVVGLMTEWVKDQEVHKRSIQDDLGGTMRLGAYACVLAEGSRVREIYGQPLIQERHRHRYEVNPAYRDAFEKGGYRFSGMSQDQTLPEIVERPDHPWFVGVQFHPEFLSKPLSPHPLFCSFVAACKAQAHQPGD
jgi:CTP synthase